MTDVPKPTVGRPSAYTQQIADEICLRIMEGEGVLSICRDEHMPAKSTVFLWKLKNEEFAAQYEEAQQIKLEGVAERIYEIADAEVAGTTYDDRRIELGRRDQQLNSFKWTLTKLVARFRERVAAEHSGPGGKPIEIANVSLTDAERADRVASLINSVRARGVGPDSDASQDVGAAGGTADDSV